jgi:hypothetical protein
MAVKLSLHNHHLVFIQAKALFQESRQFQCVELNVSISGVFCKKERSYNMVTQRAAPHVHFESVIVACAYLAVTVVLK